MRLKTDTILHFIVSLSLTYLLATPYLVTGQVLYLWMASYAVIVLCIVKEYADYLVYGKAQGLRKFLPSTLKDLAVDLLGIASAILLAVIHG
jgi:hypothetical protein